MESGRDWSISTFGSLGPRIRERVSALVYEEQVASADAQEASGHRSRSVFGQYWRGLIERFEEFGSLPGGGMVRPGKAPYKVPTIGGVVLFPWRYGDGSSPSSAGIRFATSPAREGVFDLGPIPVQGQLDIDTASEVDDAGESLPELVRALLDADAPLTSKVVVVAVGCSVIGVRDITWGEVQLTADGCLEFLWSESLLQPSSSGPTLVARPDRSFAEGEPPRPPLSMQGEEDGPLGAENDDA